jgi:hypothetical protein
VSDFYPDKFKDPPKKAPGQQEVIAGNYLLMISRALRVPITSKEDEKAIERVGELYRRWWRNLTLRRGK